MAQEHDLACVDAGVPGPVRRNDRQERARRPDSAVGRRQSGTFEARSRPSARSRSISSEYNLMRLGVASDLPPTVADDP